MSLYIGDVVRHAIHGLGVVDEIQDGGLVWVEFDEDGEYVHKNEIVLAEYRIRFSLDDDTNYNERAAWLRQLVPFYGPYDYCICSLLPDAYVGRNPAWQDDPFALVEHASLTVEADGDVAITCDLPHYPWQRFGGPGRWDNTFIDGRTRAKWYLTEHGELSHVASCEVTL